MHRTSLLRNQRIQHRTMGKAPNQGSHFSIFFNFPFRFCAFSTHQSIPDQKSIATSKFVFFLRSKFCFLGQNLSKFWFFEIKMCQNRVFRSKSFSFKVKKILTIKSLRIARIFQFFQFSISILYLFNVCTVQCARKVNCNVKILFLLSKFWFFETKMCPNSGFLDQNSSVTR